MPQRDPRYRPFRAALWVIYFTVITLAVGVLITSVVRHLRGPDRQAATGPLPTRAAFRVCVTELEALHREQNHRAWKLGDEIGQGGAIARWDVWSREWEQRVGDLSDRCRLDARAGGPEEFAGREELIRARDAVLALHRAYRAQVNRFAQEGADLAQGASRALGRAHEAAARPPERR